MILHIENPKDPTQQLLDLIKKFSKVIRYEINIHKSVGFLYTKNEILGKAYRNKIPFKIAPKKQNPITEVTPDKEGKRPTC